MNVSPTYFLYRLNLWRMTLTIKPISRIAKISRIFHCYALATFAYGFARATTYRYDNSKKYYNERAYSQEIKPMLWTDNMGRVLWHSTAAVCAWPVMLVEDLRSLECHLRGKDPSEYL